MPKPTPQPIRAAIFRRMQAGQTTAQIAEELDLHPEAVRRLIKRFNQHGEAGLATSYCRRGRPCQDYPPLLLQAEGLRREHPTWGGELIRTILRQTHAKVPSVRTIERHLAKAGLPAPLRAAVRRSPRQPRASEVHDTWQMDAADQLHLAHGQRGCWLRVIDEASGAILETAIFPPSRLECGASQPDSSPLAATLCPLRPAAPDASR